MEKKKEVVLSLFDGMSCGYLALQKAEIEVSCYLASEIEKDSIKVSKRNFPNIIHIGNVENVHYKNGILETEGGSFDVGKITILFCKFLFKSM